MYACCSSFSVGLGQDVFFLAASCAAGIYIYIYIYIYNHTHTYTYIYRAADSVREAPQGGVGTEGVTRELIFLLLLLIIIIIAVLFDGDHYYDYYDSY